MSKVVLIEQTNIINLRLEKIFSKMGFHEVVTYNNLLSFETFLNKIIPVSVVVIDFDQFGDSLDSMLKVISHFKSEPKLRVVILASKIDINEMAILYTKGIDDVVLKPFTDATLFEKLNLNRSREQTENNLIITNTIKGGSSVLSWCADYEIGIKEIDEEHEDIINHFEKLYTLMREGQGHEYYPELIKFLEGYVQKHFEHEEALQNKIAYTEYEAHKSLHDSFKNQVDGILEHYKASEVSNADLVKLNLFIKEWLSQHILVEDKKIGEFVNQSNKK